MDKRDTGRYYEDAACSYLEQHGFRVTERNFSIRQGEIDIVGYHEGYLVFAEVKYRKTGNSGMPEEAVNYLKQNKICRVADFYRMKHRIRDDEPVRYDVIAIEGTDNMRITWYRNAFPHIYAGRK